MILSSKNPCDIHLKAVISGELALGLYLGLSIILAVGRIRMTGKPTYEDLERRIKQFELDILEYQRKDKVLNEDLIREIKKRKRVERGAFTGAHARQLSDLRSLTAPPFFWMRSGNCRWNCSPNCSG